LTRYFDQTFEYKIANMMDKSTESVVGFVSVLPGAFSAYRYKAIVGAPLNAYFKSIRAGPGELDAFEGNMYLAEDRILCFELLVKSGQGRLMHYCKDAVAYTDVPADLISLIKQRRRWLNGSFFATLYALVNFGRFYRESGHSTWRKVLLTMQICYTWVVTFLSPTLIGNFWLTLHFIFALAVESKDSILPGEYAPSQTLMDNPNSYSY
jgi:chitin synthase